MTHALFGSVTGPVAAAQAYVTAYGDKDFKGLRALLHPEKFRFSHHSRAAYANSAGEFMALLERMARDIFPDRRFTEIHSIYVVDNVVLLDASWKATPIVTIPGRFEAGEPVSMALKSMMVVEDGLILEIRDYNS